MKKQSAILLSVLTVFSFLTVSFESQARSKRRFAVKKPARKAKPKIKANIDSARSQERAAILEDAGLYHAAYFERLQLARSGSAPSGNMERLGNLALVLDRLEPLRGITKSSGLPQSLRAALAAAYLREGNISAAREAAPENVNAITDSSARVKAASVVATVWAASNQSARAEDILRSVPEARDSTLGGFLQLQRARLAYGDGRLLEATEALQKVNRQSPSWHAGILVSAWSAYRSRDYNLALGQLMTLTSPYIIGKFGPEAFILQSAALYRLCYYESSLESIRKLRALYTNFPQSLDRFSRTYGNRFALVSAVINYARGSDTGDSGSYPAGHYEFIMDGLLSSEPMAEVDRSLTQVKQEQDNMSDLLRSAKLSSKLQGLYRRELESARKEYYRKGLKAATRRLAMMRREAHSALESAYAVEVEVNTRVRERLITGKAGRMKDVDFEAEIKKGYEFWPFQGEYWQDEVGGYAFATTDVCGEQGT